MPDGQHAELIDGQFYNMALPSRIHQKISYQISRLLGNYIESNGGECRVYPPPFAVNLDADDKDWVEPDISVAFRAKCKMFSRHLQKPILKTEKGRFKGL